MIGRSNQHTDHGTSRPVLVLDHNSKRIDIQRVLRRFITVRDELMFHSGQHMISVDFNIDMTS